MNVNNVRPSNYSIKRGRVELALLKASDAPIDCIKRASCALRRTWKAKLVAENNNNNMVTNNSGDNSNDNNNGLPITANSANKHSNFHYKLNPWKFCQTVSDDETTFHTSVEQLFYYRNFVDL